MKRAAFPSSTCAVGVHHWAARTADDTRRLSCTVCGRHAEWRSLWTPEPWEFVGQR